MLEQLGLLENMAKAFRALDKVRQACFSTKLRHDWSEALDEFKSAMTDLIKYTKMGINCTTKIHVVFWHVREHKQELHSSK
jgi:hypothetical protein